MLRFRPPELQWLDIGSAGARKMVRLRSGRDSGPTIPACTGAQPVDGPLLRRPVTWRLANQKGLRPCPGRSSPRPTSASAGPNLTKCGPADGRAVDRDFSSRRTERAASARARDSTDSRTGSPGPGWVRRGRQRPTPTPHRIEVALLFAVRTGSMFPFRRRRVQPLPNPVLETGAIQRPQGTPHPAPRYTLNRRLVGWDRPGARLN